MTGGGFRSQSVYCEFIRRTGRPAPKKGIADPAVAPHPSSRTETNMRNNCAEKCANENENHLLPRRGGSGDLPKDIWHLTSTMCNPGNPVINGTLCRDTALNVAATPSPQHPSLGQKLSALSHRPPLTQLLFRFRQICLPELVSGSLIAEAKRTRRSPHTAFPFESDIFDGSANHRSSCLFENLYAAQPVDRERTALIAGCASPL